MTSNMKHRFLLPALIFLGRVLLENVAAQPPGPPQPPRSPKAAAPVDFTGYWVSVISEDWRWRMVTPIKGDFASVPLNAEGQRVGNLWDPAKDEAAGLACKSYGAAALMRVPGRVHISWEDDNTLKVEADSGTQTRLFHFTGKMPEGQMASWQGYSAANWERAPRGVEIPDPFPIFATRAGTKGRSLEVVTTNLSAGYLRKNGVPYSASTRLEEYYDYHKEPNGDEWFTVTTIVNDPVYLAGPFITSSDFKKQRDAAGWDPSPCTAK
jgi:hypothetical protein